MATRNEKDTTRARANILREFLTHSDKQNRYDHKEIYEVMSLCLSCKACKSECPSNVDMAKLKAEFLQHYYDANGVPFRSKLIANFTATAKLGSIAPSLYNLFMGNVVTGNIVKYIAGFALKRSMPTLAKQTLLSWYKKNHFEMSANAAEVAQQNNTIVNKVYLFCDEFTNYNDAEIGIKAIQLLSKLGYEVIIPEHLESGRTWLSKGLVRKAKVIANVNIEKLAGVISEEHPLIGIEPSAILTFRDEYPDLAIDENLTAAKQLAKNSFYIDEFIAKLVRHDPEGPQKNRRVEHLKSYAMDVLEEGYRDTSEVMFWLGMLERT
jgi:Fe-S oxidoreductase